MARARRSTVGSSASKPPPPLEAIDTKDAKDLDAAVFDDGPVAQAQAAVEAEKTMPVRQAVRVYWRGMLWSMMLSVALIMEGYDIVLITSFFGQPSFRQQFGTVGADGTRTIPAKWQAALTNGALAGEIVGLVINGWAQYTFGSRRTYVAAMGMMVGTIFLPVFARTLPHLMGAQLLCGLPWGVFQTLTTTYAAEICPMPLRPFLTSFVNICWAIGLFIGAGVARGTLHLTGNHSWRLPLMLQWMWPVPLLVGGLFCPESPWFLVRTGQIEAAKRSIRRTAVPGHFSEADLDGRIALMQHTHEIEKQGKEGHSIWNMFRGTNLRRLEIVCVVWSMQYWCGRPMTGYATTFLQAEGMTSDQAFDVNLGSYGMLVLGTILVWFGMGRIGRRRIYLVGQLLMALELGIMGVLGCFTKHTGVSYGVATIMLVFNLTFACTVGPTCYTIVAELPAADVRAPTVVAARTAYLISGIINNQLTPRMVNTNAWGWGARCGFFFLGTNLLGTVYCYFRLPETKGRSYGELDAIFAARVPARKFEAARVDEFGQLAGSDKAKQ